MNHTEQNQDVVRHFQSDDDESAELEERAAMRPDDEQIRAAIRQRIEEQLDDALANTFPASDPVAIVTSFEEEDWGV